MSATTGGARALLRLASLVLAAALAVSGLTGCAALATLLSGTSGSAAQDAAYSNGLDQGQSGGADSDGASLLSGGRALAQTPVVNSAIYSNDYIIDEGPIKGGGMRVYATHPDTFNPLLTQNIYAAAMFGLVYDSLVSIGPGLTAEPRLAVRWTPSIDGLVWHIVLREGAKWHDGRPLRAYDAVNTIERIRSYGEWSPYAGAIANIASAVAVSDHEIRLTLEKENAFAPYTWVFPIMPSHVAIDALDGQSGSANLRAALVGSGAYRFRYYENRSRLVLTAADTWWGAGDEAAGPVPGIAPTGRAEDDHQDQAENDQPGRVEPDLQGKADVRPPYIIDISFMFFDPDDMALTKFRSKEVDLFFSGAFDYDRFKHSSELLVRQYSERDFLFLALNNAGGATASRNVRRALLRMLDRQGLIDEALGGRGVPSEFPVQPESSLYGAGIASTPYDPQAARSILEGEGFRLDEGVYYGDAGNGWNKLSLTLLVNEQDAERCALADSLSDMYAGHGVEIVVSREPADAVMQKVLAGGYEMALLNYRTHLFPDMTELYSTPWKEPGSGGGAVANVARFQDDEADRLSHELFSLYDEDDRQTAFAQLAAIIQDEAPYIGICFRASVLVYGEGLRGDIYPSDRGPLSFMERWYIADYR
ncbi:MAG: peptide ABC transporter substrate-binding protein [Oscillospiraceae bacterium]|nr:peptide ABC transporter substrate-binding protein [Oscillospiraceae bacterium]